MARKLLVLLLAAAITAASWSAASAQSCTGTIISLAPCLGFIQGSSSTPSSSCCTQLASVVQSQPRCLCQVLNGGSAPFGITVNQTQALALPGACNVQTPSPALCNSGAPAVPPAAAPSSPPAPTAPSPPSTPATPSPPSTPAAPVPPTTPSTPGTPSPQTPSTPAAPATPSIPSPSGNASAGTSNKVALSILFALLFAASIASTGSSF